MSDQTVQYATDVATLPNPESSTTALVLDSQAFDKIMSVAEVMANGRSTVPKHLQGNAADCMAIIIQSMQWKMNPFVVAQKTHIVNGALGYEAQLVNAVVSNSGAIKGRFHYEYRGEGNAMECRVGAIVASEDEITWNEWLKISDITTKNSPLWKTNPRQQMGYLQVKNWARAFTPGALLGVYTADELADSRPLERDITPRKTATDYAEAAKPDVGTTDAERLVMIRDMEMIVRGPGATKDRVVDLNLHWKNIGKAGRAAVGKDEYTRLYELASAEDAVPATKTDQTVVDAETGEVAQENPDDNPFGRV